MTTRHDQPGSSDRPFDGFRWIDRSWGRSLQSAALAEVADHLFTTRQLRLRGECESEEWTAVAAALGVEPSRLLRPRQVHGRAGLVHRRGDPIPPWSGSGPEADIIATDDPAVTIAVQVADCIPILIADPRSGAVAAAHAGWRGSALRVAVHAVRALEDQFGARPDELQVAFGPSIGPCCYEVGVELRAAFLDAGFAAREVARWFAPDGASRQLRLDLWAANREQLASAGVPVTNIHLCRLCTVDHRDTFFSYRAEGPGTGRIVGAVRSRGPRRP